MSRLDVHKLFIFSRYLSELSLSTEGMCGRPFPWSDLPGPEPPDETRNTLALPRKTNHLKNNEQCRFVCHVFTRAFIVTSSYSSKRGVPVFAR